MVTTGLSRELLKWLQSLDLPYSVKNVKRDFSNGFLVAEIFSRYYQADVEMHSYDNGQSLQRKLDNWAQLYKFFAKRAIKLDRELVNDVVHCKSAEAPVQLISQIYTQLTGREVRPAARVGDGASLGVDPTETPAYARPNATSLLAANIKESELTTTLEDQTAAQARAKALIDEHSATLRQDREVDTTRFQSSSGYGSSAMQRVLRGPPKPVSQELESAQVRFQEVKVRSVDRNIAQLRASRDPQLQGGGAASPSVGPAASVSAVSEVAAASPPPVVVADTGAGVLQILSERVGAVEGLGVMPGGSPADIFNAFLDQLNKIPPAASVRAIDSANVDASALAAACVSSPKQAWQLFDLLSKVLACADDRGLFSAVVALLCTVGRNVVATTDASFGEAMLRDFGFASILPLVKALPGQMRELLQVVFAFSADTPRAHINVIKALQDKLADQTMFIMALTALVRLETAFDDNLLDLYVYYCVIALGMASCRLRAAALSMLPVVVGQSRELVVQMLPRLVVIAEDPWWEIQAQLGKVCCALLPGAGEEAPQVITLLKGVLDNRCPSVQSLVLSETAPLLAARPALLAPFLQNLLAMPVPQRALLLAPGSDPVPLPAVSSDSYALNPLPASWPALAVATELILSTKAAKLDNLESSHAQVLAALLAGPFNPAEQSEWRDWLLSAKDYLYVALCDEELCDSMAASLLSLFAFVQDGALPTFSTLLSSLRMLFQPEVSPVCQSVAVSFLTQLYERGPPFTGAIFDLVSNFDANLRASALSQLVARVESEQRS